MAGLGEGGKNRDWNRVWTHRTAPCPAYTPRVRWCGSMVRARRRPVPRRPAAPRPYLNVSSDASRRRCTAAMCMHGAMGGRASGCPTRRRVGILNRERPSDLQASVWRWHQAPFAILTPNLECNACSSRQGPKAVRPACLTAADAPGRQRARSRNTATPLGGPWTWRHPPRARTRGGSPRVR